ncbi:MAG: hypothetical protein WEB30_18615 [Cyclobacteriaceae bacterium]
MKNSFAFFLFSVLVSTLTGCSDPEQEITGLTEEQRRKMQSDVINRFHAVIKYSEAGELENVLDHFDPSAPGIYIDGLTRYASLDDMILNYRATWKIAKQDYGIPETKIFVLSPVYVLVTSSSTITTTNRDGTAFQPRLWSLSTLWILKDGQWLIHSFHQNSGELKPVEVDVVPPA